MGKRGRASTLILIILVLISLSLGGGVYYLLLKEREAKQQLQVQLDEANTQISETKNRLEESKKTVSSLEERLYQAKIQTDSLAKSVESEKKLREEAVAKLDRLSASLEEQKKAKDDLTNLLSASQKEVTTLQEQLHSLQAKQKDLEAKVGPATESKVELGKIVVSPENATSPVEPVADAQATTDSTVAATAPQSNADQAGLQGKVLVINKDYNFVVTNLGKKDGINLGDVFSVYHQESYLGDVKIEKIHDSMSAAGFVSQEIKEKVSEGDRVVQKE